MKKLIYKKVILLLVLNLTAFFAVILQPFSQICSKAMAEADILEIIESKMDFLEQHIPYSEMLYVSEYGKEPEPSIFVGDFVLKDGSQYSIEYHKGTKYKKYEEFKKALLENASHYATMLFLGSMPTYLNVNGNMYIFESLGSWYEGGIRFNNVEILEDTDQYIKVLASYRLSSDEIVNESVVELKKFNGEWMIDYVEGIVGTPTNERNLEDMTWMFQKYVHHIIKGYVVSENINCGYKKFSEKLTAMFFPDFEGINVNVTSFNSDDLTGSAYAIVDEYGKNGDVVAQHKITVDIREVLEESITDVIISGENPNTNDFSVIFYVLFAASASLSICLIKKEN